jgi:dihydroorotate dehydrogenase electron transfer subunit
MKPWLAAIRYNQQLTDSVYALGLDPLENSPGREKISQALPGQFYMLKLPRQIDPLLRRPFSHYRVTKHENIEALELIYEVKGKGTEILSRLECGEVLSLIGPLGKGFSVLERAQHLIMVAGGLGVIPLFSLLKSLEEWHEKSEGSAGDEKRTVDFIWGVKTRKNFFRLEELNGRGIKVHLVSEDGSHGQRGMATDLLRQVLEEYPDLLVRVFACGPKDMLKQIAAHLREENMACQFSMEEKMACGFGACLGCAVPARSGGYLHVCKDGPVFDANEIDWKSI